MMVNNNLVGGIPTPLKLVQICNWFVVSTPLKNMKVSWDYYSQAMEK